MRKRSLSFSLFFLMVSAFVFFGACNAEIQIREENDETMVKLDNWGNTVAVSTVEVNLITLFGEEDSEFVCSTRRNDPKREGVFLSDTHSSGTPITVSSNSTLAWSCLYYDDANNMLIAKKDTIWLKFINRKDSRILGYAVVKVNKIADYNYEATVVKSVTFPKADGADQAITEKEVNRLIDNVIG